MALTAIIEIAPLTNRNPTTNCVTLKFFGFGKKERKLECSIAYTNGNSKIENDLVTNYVHGSISNSSACSS